jgi:hypothetical protein
MTESPMPRIDRAAAIEIARAEWGEGQPGWTLDVDGIRLADPGERFMIYSQPTAAFWYVPVRSDLPRLGSAHAIIVDAASGAVRRIIVGE